jgi:hypothetical protein
MGQVVPISPIAVSPKPLNKSSNMQLSDTVPSDSQ